LTQRPVPQAVGAADEAERRSEAAATPVP